MFDKYIGIPFKNGGRDLNGLDCYGLVYLIYKEVYKIDLPEYSMFYDTENDVVIEKLISENKSQWKSVKGDYRPGDVILFKMFRYANHIGMIVSQNKFIHSDNSIFTCVEDFTKEKWKKRIVEVYRYERNN